MNLGPMAHASHCSGKAHTMVYLQATGIGLQIHSLHSLHMLHPQLIYICRVHNYQKPLNNSVLWTSVGSNCHLGSETFVGPI